MLESNSAFHPVLTQVEPDFAQFVTGTDPSNQTASFG